MEKKSGGLGERRIMKIEGQAVEIPAPATEIFHFLEKMDHVGLLMPEQITDWKGNELSAEFNIKNLGSSGLCYGLNEYPLKINMLASERSKIKFELNACIKELAPDVSRIYFELLADVNPFIASMVTKPLQHLTDTMAKNIKHTFTPGASQ